MARDVDPGSTRVLEAGAAAGGTPAGRTGPGRGVRVLSLGMMRSLWGEYAQAGDERGQEHIRTVGAGRDGAERAR